MCEYLFDDYRVFDAGDDFNGTAACGTGFCVDIAYRDVRCVSRVAPCARIDVDAQWITATQGGS